MSLQDTRLTTHLADPDLLLCVLPTARLLEDSGRQRGWPDGWTAWSINPLGERRAYDSPAQAADDDVNTLYLVRTSPLRLEFDEPDASTKDDFSCHAHVAVDVRISDVPSDLQAFHERVARSGKIFRVSELADFLRPAIAPLIRRFIRQHPAEALLNAQPGDAFEKHLCDGLARLFFESGIILLGRPTLRCESEAFHRVRTERRRADREEQRLALQQEVRECRRQAREHHLEHLESQLERLQRLADADPSLSLSDLVRAFSETERGEIYEALIRLRPPGQRTARVVVASAGELTLVDPQRPADAPERRPIEGRAGLLRSVQAALDSRGRTWLLIGARQGIYRMDPGDGKPAESYVIPEGRDPFRGGVNSVALCTDCLLASHSEAGLIRWRLGEPDRPEFLLPEQTRAADAVRHVCQVGASIWLSIDHRVLRMPAGDLRAEAATAYEGNAVPVTALHVDETRVLAGTQTGRILCWDLEDPSSPQVLERGRGRPVESIHLLSGRGLDRLLFCDHSNAATARLLDDAFACLYRAGGHELRWIVVHDDLFVGVNTPRDRILLWRPHEPAEPFSILPVSAWTGHSIQGLCLIPHGTA